MLADSEAEVACRAKVLLLELVFLDFETAFEDFFRFGASYCDVHSDFLVSTDAKGTNGVAGFACVQCLIRLVEGG